MIVTLIEHVEFAVGNTASTLSFFFLFFSWLSVVIYYFILLFTFSSGLLLWNNFIHCFLYLFFRVGVISHIPAGRSLKMTFTRLVEGRYVTVVLPGSGKVLTLCEVEVYGYRAPTGEELICYWSHTRCDFLGDAPYQSLNCIHLSNENGQKHVDSCSW